MARLLKRPRKTVVILDILALAAILWLGGFVWFVATLREAPEAPSQKTDGIVVFTGGPHRIALAAQLLSRGLAERLLVSGVYGAVDDETLRRTVGISSDLFACCIDTGRDAVNTEGNAVETAAWVTAHGYKSLRIVTDTDHMPRSLMELRRALPGVALIAHPVSRLTVNDRVKRPGVGRLALEYVKLTRVAVMMWIADLRQTWGKSHL